MRFGVLKSVAHNIADSLASGASALVGVYDDLIFNEATKAQSGRLDVNFLTGEVTGGKASERLVHVAGLFRDALPGLCARHGFDVSALRVLTASYGVDRVYGRHVTVTVEDDAGRRSVERFNGTTGRRIKAS